MGKQPLKVFDNLKGSTQNASIIMHCKLTSRFFDIILLLIPISTINYCVLVKNHPSTTVQGNSQIKDINSHHKKHIFSNPSSKIGIMLLTSIRQ
jgi:hypothetical protein